MTDAQIRYGFWHIEKGIVPPKDFATYFDQYRGSEKLRLIITQTNLSSYQQKKNVEDWCNRLSELKQVKYLWLSSKVNQMIFDAVCTMPNLEGVWIKWSGIKKLDNLPQLKKLKHVKLGSSSQVESIEVLEAMTNLETLELEQLNKISDFTPISNLTQLKGLGIDGGMWKAQVIESLAPISDLTQLRYLSTTNSRIQDKSFDPILTLKNLVRFNCSWNYPESEFEKLKSLPNLKYGNIETSWKEVKAKMK